jgi:ribosomal protein L21E
MKFKIGDKVKITDGPSVKEWNYWVYSMDETIGKTGKIISKSEEFGECYRVEIKLEIKSVIWLYPEFALKKVNNLPDNLFILD